jgi:hypothetical protein
MSAARHSWSLMAAGAGLVTQQGETCRPLATLRAGPGRTRGAHHGYAAVLQLRVPENCEHFFTTQIGEAERFEDLVRSLRTSALPGRMSAGWSELGNSVI